ncbi:1-acyl-sn-glycerol-3-phosphate acyltransferase [Paenibacillus sp. MBLB4367]|uniref:1-acyl-sn-glycerol-3-phosphate acyltransferase n=1 Tax=Paenibacillus sp. MBLB4367 TaxID=3384767 RepID=UPI00390818A1
MNNCNRDTGLTMQEAPRLPSALDAYDRLKAGHAARAAGRTQGRAANSAGRERGAARVMHLLAEAQRSFAARMSGAHSLFLQAYRPSSQRKPEASAMRSANGALGSFAEDGHIGFERRMPVNGLPGQAEGADPGKDRTALSLNGFRFGYESLLHCAVGLASEAFGDMYRMFDDGRQIPRLPAPPFLFVSRIMAVTGLIGEVREGTSVTAEYDIPPDAWYFAEGGGRMPYAVLLEAALQPCGWLTAYMGVPLLTETPLYFRNLDGRAQLYREVRPGDGTLRTTVELTRLTRLSDTFVETFRIRCHIGEELVYELTTVFGHFPIEALRNQAGLPGPISPAYNPYEDEPVQPFCSASAMERSPVEERLRMIGSIIRFEPHGGAYGRGRIVAETAIHPDQWFFKAHFFRDPVQPGSLGIEAMLQAVRWYMNETGLAEVVSGIEMAPESVLNWKYRGQVLPHNRSIRVVVDIADIETKDGVAVVTAEAALWTEGKAIYAASGMKLQVRTGDTSAVAVTVPLDIGREPWLKDHCPTYTMPVMPFTFLADYMIRAVRGSLAPGMRVTAMRDVRIFNWLVCAQPSVLRVEAKPEAGSGRRQAAIFRMDAGGSESRSERIMTACIETGSGYPAQPSERPAPLANPAAAPNPYDSGRVFHGESFRIVERLVYGDNGSSATLNLGLHRMLPQWVPALLLDAVMHAIPHDALERWDAGLPSGRIAYPYAMPEIVFYGPFPDAGRLECEIRYLGPHRGQSRYPAFRAWLYASGMAIAELTLVEIMFPQTRLGMADGQERRQFLRDRRYKPGLALSRFHNGNAILSESEVRQADWLPGTLRQLYLADGTGSDLTRSIVSKEAAAAIWQVHPSAIEIAPRLFGGVTATCRQLPFARLDIELTETAEGVTAVPVEREQPELSVIDAYWSERTGVSGWLIEDIYRALASRFVGRFAVEDPDSLAKLAGKPVLYLGNHQSAVESLLFSYLTGGLLRMPVVGLAKAEHEVSWIGKLLRLAASYPGIRIYRTMMLFDRDNRRSMLELLHEMRSAMTEEGLSVLIHVEGTRATSCRTPVRTMSSTLIDLAVSSRTAIVPVRFSGGLPLGDTGERQEFPVGYGKQDYFIGKPIMPDRLEALPYAERKRAVMDAINGLGTNLEEELPYPPATDWADKLREWTGGRGISPEWAVILQCLNELDAPSKETSALLDAVRRGETDIANTWLTGVLSLMKEGNV